jgi:hypothetical protein
MTAAGGAIAVADLHVLPEVPSFNLILPAQA